MTSLAAGKSQECHICLEELRQDLVACPCGHVFHHACILQALQVNRQCPICRRAASDADLINLYFDVPTDANATHSHHTATSSPSDASSGTTASNAHAKKLADRVNALVDRLQWQKKQYDALTADNKRVRQQSEQLVLDKQGLLHRITALESNKKVLVTKVAKYQLELSRLSESLRQMALNQSIINFLDSCDADAIEDEIQNPRELILALKKACKFRHDQYQKAVKDKMRLKAMLQSVAAASSQQPPQQQATETKSKGRSTKRPYEPAAAHLHPLELKKRKWDTTGADAAKFAPPPHSAIGVRANTYTDVTMRPTATPSSTARPTFTRSAHNPNQYGAYNLVPATAAPVPTSLVSSDAVCRRGYDETGKLTTFFMPKEPVRSSSARHPSSSTGRRKVVPSMQHLLASTAQVAGSNSSSAIAQQTTVAAGGGSSRSDRREFALTDWLRNDA